MKITKSKNTSKINLNYFIYFFKINKFTIYIYIYIYKTSEKNIIFINSFFYIFY